MYLEVFSDNSFDTNCWLIAAEGSDDAIVVDPGFEPARVHALLDAAGKRPAAVLATHGHYDHIGSAGEFCGDDVPFYIHEADELAITDARTWGAGFPTPPIEIKDVRTIADGDALELAGFRLEVVHTPGHTPGSTCYVVGPFLFSGDTLFPGGPGNTQGHAKRFARVMESLDGLFASLPDDTRICPGHGIDSTIGRERPHVETWRARGW